MALTPLPPLPYDGRRGIAHRAAMERPSPIAMGEGLGVRASQNLHLRGLGIGCLAFGSLLSTFGSPLSAFTFPLFTFHFPLSALGLDLAISSSTAANARVVSSQVGSVAARCLAAAAMCVRC